MATYRLKHKLYPEPIVFLRSGEKAHFGKQGERHIFTTTSKAVADELRLHEGIITAPKETT